MENCRSPFVPSCLYNVELLNTNYPGSSPVGLSPPLFGPSWWVPIPCQWGAQCDSPTSQPSQQGWMWTNLVGNHISRYEAIKKSLHKFGVSDIDRVSEQQRSWWCSYSRYMPCTLPGATPHPIVSYLHANGPSFWAKQLRFWGLIKGLWHRINQAIHHDHLTPKCYQRASAHEIDNHLNHHMMKIRSPHCPLHGRVHWLRQGWKIRTRDAKA